MAAQTPKERLDELIVAAERKLNRLKALRNAVEDDEFADEIAQIFAVAPATKAEAPPRRSVNMETVESYFKARDNEWATVAEVAEATEMSIHSLRQLIYRSHTDHFKRESSPGKETQIRLAGWQEP